MFNFAPSFKQQSCVILRIRIELLLYFVQALSKQIIDTYLSLSLSYYHNSNWLSSHFFVDKCHQGVHVLGSTMYNSVITITSLKEHQCWISFFQLKSRYKTQKVSLMVIGRQPLLWYICNHSKYLYFLPRLQFSQWLPPQLFEQVHE